MKFWSRLILIVAVVFLAGIFYWAVFSPKQEISQRIYQTLKEQDKRADFAFKEVSFEEVLDGVKYWQLTARTAPVNKSTQIATLQEARGTFFRNGKPVLRFRSPAALWDMKNREILLDKPLGYDVKLDRKINSLIRSLETSPLSIFNLPKLYNQGLGYWFQASNLSWKMADQKLICTGGIVLNKGEATGYATRLEGDVALEQVSLQGSPRLEIAPPKSAPITLEAAELSVISAQDRFVARGNPVITWREAKVTADNIDYVQQKNLLQLNRNVRINYQDIQAAGDSARYLTGTNTVVITGNAQANQGDNKLTGQEVNVSLGEKKISIAGQGKVVITEEELK
jgi:lipopolysaccharide export system protein LptA